MNERIEKTSELIKKIENYPELQSYLMNEIKDKELLTLYNLPEHGLVMYCLYTGPRPSLIISGATCDAGIYDGTNVNEKLIAKFYDHLGKYDPQEGTRVEIHELYDPSNAPSNLELASLEGNIITIEAKGYENKRGWPMTYEVCMDLRNPTPFQEQRRLK